MDSAHNGYLGDPSMVDIIKTVDSAYNGYLGNPSTVDIIKTVDIPTVDIAYKGYLGDPGMVNIIKTVDSLNSFRHMCRRAVGCLCCAADLVHVALECLNHLKDLAHAHRVTQT